MRFSNQQKTDIVLCYGEARGNSAAARRLYRHRFPHRAVPNARTFDSVVEHLRETGSFKGRFYDRGRHRAPAMVNIEEQILDAVHNSPEISVRRLSLQLEVSPFVVWNTLHEQGLYPYHLQQVQTLKEDDFPRRRAFCNWVLQKNVDDPNFIHNLMCTDEATFTKDGIFNMHNTHVWSDENPHAVREMHSQNRFSLNVWAGIYGEHLVGPYILPPRLTGESYLHFLETTFDAYLDELPLERLRRLWFMHDGAPAHSTREVTDWLNQHFPLQWIGRNGPVLWPARSPDFNSCDFFLWGYLKNLVYATPVNSLEDLTARLHNAAGIIRAQPGKILRSQESLLRRVQLCLDNEGRHFEQLLKK